MTRKKTSSGEHKHWSLRALLFGWRFSRRFVISVLLAISLIIISLSVVVRMQSFQQYVVDKATEYLSKELNTTVRIGYIDIDFFDILSLKEVEIYDERRDTLLYAGSLGVNFSAIDLLGSKLKVERVWLEDVRAKVYNDSASVRYNYEFIVDYIAGLSGTGKSSSQSSPIQLDVKEVDLRRVHIDLDNRFKGLFHRYWLGSLTILPDKLDLDKGEIAIKKVLLDGVRFDIHKSVDRPLYEAYRAEQKVRKGAQRIVDTLLKAEKPPLVIRVGKVDIRNGVFSHVNDNMRVQDDRIDFNHIRVHDFHTEIDSVKIIGDDIRADFKEFGLKTERNFEITQLRASTHIASTEISLTGLELKTPNSVLRDTFRLRFNDLDDFKDFENLVRFDVATHHSYVTFADIMAFAPELSRVDFFELRKHDRIDIVQGYAKMPLNKLKLTNLHLSADDISVQGDFRLRNITERGEEFIEGDIERLTVNHRSIGQFGSLEETPAELKRLGTIQFKGTYVGYPEDFVVAGDIGTAVGELTTDLRINLKEGAKHIQYSGRVASEGFDLRKLLDNKDLGKLALDVDVSGKGLDAETVDAKVKGKVSALGIMGYEYHNIAVDGSLVKKKFEGKVSIDDESAKLDLQGIINLTDSIPVVDIRSGVQQIDLHKLNLSKEEIRIRGDIVANFKGFDMQHINGEAKIRSLLLEHNGKKYPLDTLSIQAVNDMASGEKTLSLVSSIATVRLKGIFDLSTLPNALQCYFIEQHPQIAHKMAMRCKTTTTDTLINDVDGSIQVKIRDLTTIKQDFAFDIRVNKTDDISQLLLADLKSIHVTKCIGRFSNIDHILELDMTVPHIQVDNNQLDSVQVVAKTEGQSMLIDVGARRLKFGSTIIPQTYLSGYLVQDTLFFGSNITQVTNLLSDFNINGQLFFAPDAFQLTFDPSNFSALGTQWDISENNYIRFGANYLETQNLLLSNQEKRIRFFARGNKGLSATLENIDLEWLTTQLNLRKTLPLYGNLTVASFNVDDIFALGNFSENRIKGIKGFAFIDSLALNNFVFGDLNTYLHASDDGYQVIIDSVSIQQSGNTLRANGFYVIPHSAAYTYPSNYMKGYLHATNYPSKLLEIIIPDLISNTKGTFTANVEVDGLPDDINIRKGDVVLDSTSTTVNYLQTTYLVPKYQTRITNYNIDLNNLTLYDEQGNPAKVSGSLTHQRFKNFGADIKVTAPRLQLLQTTKKDNNLFYGNAIGSAELHLYGSFDGDLTMDITGTSAAPTHIMLPLSGENYGNNKLSFIRFVKPDTLQNTTQPTKPKSSSSLEINLDLNITPDAEVQLVFDEQTGEIMTGRGRGNLRLEVPRIGDFKIYGQYTLEQGSYLFNFRGISNKPFSLVNGGTIVWSNGNPYDAQLNLRAKLNGLTASPLPLVEQSVPEESKESYKRSIPVDLFMDITGVLTKPDIKFDLQFPNVTPDQRTLLDAKVQAMKQDQSELSKQVFGLIVLGAFVPENFGDQTNIAGSLVNNTLSELLSSQLSRNLNDLLASTLGTGSVFSGIDLDLGYRQSDFNNNNNLQVGIKNYFFDNRLVIKGNIDVANVGSSTTSRPGTDVTIEYALVPSGEVKAFVYNRFTPNELASNSQSNKTGGGVSFRHEFDPLTRQERKLRREKRKAQRATPPPTQTNEPITPQ
jgi:hypothetical protein